MLIKIVAVSKPWVWYRGMVGKTFLVTPTFFGYRVEEIGPHHDEVVLIRDCIVLKGQEGELRAYKRMVM